MEENKEVVVESGRKVIKLSRKKFVISIVVIVALVLVSLVLLSSGSVGQLLGYLFPIFVTIFVIWFIWGVIAYFITTDLILRSKAKKKMRNSLIFLLAVAVLWVILAMMTRTFGVGPEQLNRSAIPCVPNPEIGIDCGGGGAELFSVGSSFGRSKSSNRLPPMYDGGGQASISDTREFLKTSYNSTIKTRDVNDVVRYVKNAINGADGRIDSLSVSEKYGSISFVVAKSKFEDFRTEIEALTHEKLYTEGISSENLLTQKQGIEEQQENTVNSLESLLSQRDSLVAKHSQAVSSLNKEITRIGKELVSVRASMKTETDSILLASLYNQENSLIQQETLQKKNLTNENSTYATKKQNLDNMINNENNNLANINEVDDQFMDNVETVNGYINVQWISLWEMARIFSPIHPIFVIIILLILAWVFLRKSSFVPKVVLE